MGPLAKRAQLDMVSAECNGTGLGQLWREAKRRQPRGLSIASTPIQPCDIRQECARLKLWTKSEKGRNASTWQQAQPARSSFSPRAADLLRLWRVVHPREGSVHGYFVRIFRKFLAKVIPNRLPVVHERAHKLLIFCMCDFYHSTKDRFQVRLETCTSHRDGNSNPSLRCDAVLQSDASGTPPKARLDVLCPTLILHADLWECQRKTAGTRSQSTTSTLRK